MSARGEIREQRLGAGEAGRVADVPGHGGVSILIEYVHDAHRVPFVPAVRGGPPWYRTPVRHGMQGDPPEKPAIIGKARKACPDVEPKGVRYSHDRRVRAQVVASLSETFIYGSPGQRRSLVGSTLSTRRPWGGQALPPVRPPVACPPAPTARRGLPGRLAPFNRASPNTPPKSRRSGENAGLRRPLLGPEDGPVHLGCPVPR